MIDFLIKRFIKDYQEYDDPKVREAYGVFAAIVGLLSNILLFIIKLVIGLLFHSVAIMADAINNLMDSASSVITMVGFRLASKPADQDHPFGHARIESISGLIVAFIIMIVGLQFVQSSYDKIINPISVNLSGLTIFLLVFTMIVKIWQSYFNHVIGSKIKSYSLLATALDSRNDVLVTLTVLIGGIIETLFNYQIDGYIGLLLSVFIIKSGYEMVKDTVDELLGKMPSYEFVKTVEDLIKQFDILGFHDLIVHNYGHNQTYASVHIELDANKTPLEMHEIADQIEKAAYKELDTHMVVHQDPIILDDPKLLAQEEKISQIIHEYDAHFTFHDLRIVEHPDDIYISVDVVVYDCEKEDFVIRNELENKIANQFNNSEVYVTIDRNYMSTKGIDKYDE